jgi:hypothetical protein
MLIFVFTFTLLACAPATDGGPDLAVIGGRIGPTMPRIAIVRWPLPIDVTRARAFAATTGGTVASVPDEASNELLSCLRSTPQLALGPCEGPWIGLERPAGVPPGQSWRWIDRTPVTFTRWAEGSPAGSVRIAAVAALAEDGLWIDSIPSVDAGSEIRSAAIAWPAASDQDDDGVPDSFPIEDIPTTILPTSLCGGLRTDLDGNGRVDSADLAIVLAAWGTSQELPDIDADGIVGPLDLGGILAAWTGD